MLVIRTAVGPNGQGRSGAEVKLLFVAANVAELVVAKIHELDMRTESGCAVQ